MKQLSRVIRNFRDSYPYAYLTILLFIFLVVVVGLNMYLANKGVAMSPGGSMQMNIVGVLESRIIELERSLETLSSDRSTLTIVPYEGDWYKVDELVDLYSQYKYIINDLEYENVSISRGLGDLEEGYNFIVINNRYSVDQLNYLLRDVGDFESHIHVVNSVSDVDKVLGTNVIGKLPVTVFKAGDDIKIYEGVYKEVGSDERR